MLTNLKQRLKYMLRNNRKMHVFVHEVYYRFLEFHNRDRIKEGEALIEQFACQKDKCFVILDRTVGDNALALPYLYNLNKAFSIQHLVIVGTSHKLQMVEAYANEIEENVELENEKYLNLYLYLSSKNGYKRIKKEKNIIFICPFCVVRYEKIPAKLHLVNILKDYIFCFKTPCEMKIPDLLPFYKQLNISIPFVENKTVLLCPDSISFLPPDIAYFDLIAYKLKQMGYIVYTNIISQDDRIILGTYPLKSRLTEIIVLAEKFGYVVGARSGLMDLMTYAKCTGVAVYNKRTIKDDVKQTDLEQVHLNARIYSQVLTGSNESDVERTLELLRIEESYERKER